MKAESIFRPTMTAVGTLIQKTYDILKSVRAVNTKPVQTEKVLFILTEKKKFYIDTDIKQSIDNEISMFNKNQKNESNSFVTEVSINGNRVLVPVTIGYAGKRIEATMLLDTGASIVTLHRNIAEKLKISFTQKANLQLAGGQQIAADIARLGYVSVGPNKKKDVLASVIDHNDPSADYDGLLGMNFLRNLRYEVDFEKSVIRWYQ